MNRTVQGLALQKISLSPLFVLHCSSLMNSLAFNQMKISKFTSSFLYSDTGRGLIDLQQSTFNNFLHNAIQIENREIFLANLEKELYDEQIKISQKLRLNIKYCIFENIKAYSDGGCLAINNIDCLVKIEASGFRNSNTNSSGGAICFFGHQIQILSSCFYRCSSSLYDQAMYIRMGKDGNSFMYGSTISECGKGKTKAGSYMVRYQKGNSEIQLCNSSSNLANKKSCGFSFRYPDSFTLITSLIFFNEGENILQCHGNSVNDKFEKNVFMGNKASVSFIIAYQSDITLKSCNFLRNKYTVFCSNGSISLKSCLSDKRISDEEFVLCNVKEKHVLVGNFDPPPDVKIDQYKCWAMGVPSRSPTQSLPPMYRKEESSAFRIFGMVAIFGGIPLAFIIYFVNKICANPTDLNTLVDIEIS